MHASKGYCRENRVRERHISFGFLSAILAQLYGGPQNQTDR